MVEIAALAQVPRLLVRLPSLLVADRPVDRRDVVVLVVVDALER